MMLEGDPYVTRSFVVSLVTDLRDGLVKMAKLYIDSPGIAKGA